jgi:hypothetical protein
VGEEVESRKEKQVHEDYYYASHPGVSEPPANNANADQAS